MKRVLFFLLTTGLCSCATVDDFMLGKDNSPKPAELSRFTPSMDASMQWRKSVGNGTDGSALKLAPVISNNQLITASQNGLVSVSDKSSGKTLWSAKLPTKLVSGPAVGQGIIVVGSTDAKIIAMDQTSGKVLWENPVSNEVLSPAAVNKNHVFAKTVDGKLYAFDKKTGKQSWIYDHGSPGLILRSGSAPIVSNDKLIVGFADGKLDLIDTENGRLLWQRIVSLPHSGSAVEQMNGIDANPVVRDGVIYVATFQGHIAAVRLNNGEIIWRKPFSTYSGLALDGNKLYASDSKGQVWAFDKRTGSVFWLQKQLAGRTVGAPSVVGKALALGDGLGYLHFLSLENGDFMARLKVGYAKVQAPPVASSNQLYVMADDGEVIDYKVSA